MPATQRPGMPATQRPGGGRPAPVGAKQRVLAMDVLRGFAVLGLMLVHIIVFSRPVDPLGDPTAGLSNEGANRAFLWGVHVLVSSKFMFLFALLFGAGVMFFDRKSAGDRLRDGAGLWYARMGWLAAIGLAHGVFLFFGDILFVYALAGMGLLWWLRRLQPGILVTIGAVMYVFAMAMLGGLMLLVLYFVEGDDRVAMAEGMGNAAQINAYLGTYADTLLIRLKFMVNNLVMIPLMTFWGTSGIMLLGMALVKWGVLTGQRSVRFYAVLAGVGIAIGVPLSAVLYAWVERGDFQPERNLVFVTLFQPAGVPLALGYLGLVMLLVKLQALRPVQTALAAVGRMALSNYLLHSLCGAVIFHGWGLGLYAEMQFPALFGIVVAVWALNIFGSLLWLRCFQFGPAEWLWRSLTYMQVQPLRKAAD